MKGTIWCSHNELISIFRTITIFEFVFSENTPDPMTSATVFLYPLQKNLRAFAALKGVSTNPGRLGSSPKHCKFAFRKTQEKKWN